MIVIKLEDPEQAVREAALHALGETGQAKAYLPQIVELFKVPDRSVRGAAARAIGATGLAEAYLPQIVELFKDPAADCAPGGSKRCCCDGRGG